ncbi:MAG TPA: hypothetical protein VGN97_14415 [Mesorhizobium sp.]|jgi:hypothetical protein|nr:hypothetical protein [Mesorhizobium sp.]
MPDQKFGDKALSILTFAAYHTLTSGNLVREVVLEDGSGHRADPDGVKELEAAGFLEPDGQRGRLTDAGEAALTKLLEHIRATQGPRVGNG